MLYLKYIEIEILKHPQNKYNQNEATFTESMMHIGKAKRSNQ